MSERDDAIRTACRALENAAILITKAPGHINMPELSVAAECQRALAALDKLAVEPSEDAREFLYDISTISSVNYIDEGADLITIRDERIRAEALREAAEEVDELRLAARAVLRATDRVAFAWTVGKCGPLSKDSCYIPDIKSSLERLRAAILAPKEAHNDIRL